MRTKTKFESLATRLLLLLITLTVFTGCGKATPESMRNRFNARLDNAAEIKANWPGFATVLEAEVKAAKKEFEEAESAADVEAMKTINSRSMPLLSKLEECHHKYEGCEKQISALRKLKLGELAHQKRKDTIHEAELTLNEINLELATAKPKLTPSAINIAKAGVEELIELGGELRRAEKSYTKSTKKYKDKKSNKLKLDKVEKKFKKK